jgi:hypothetical protein
MFVRCVCGDQDLPLAYESGFPTLCDSGVASSPALLTRPSHFALSQPVALGTVAAPRPK